MTEVNERTVRMITRRGFIDVFWEQVKLHPDMTYEAVYDMLENEYLFTFGIRRYASYDSFRRRRDKK